MAETGISYRLHSYNPDNIYTLPPLIHESTTLLGWLCPVKKVLRDTVINQYTWYVLGMADPPEGQTLTAKICLYRAVNNISLTLTAGTTYFIKVTNSEVSVTNPSLLAQTQWTLTNSLYLEGGTYAWGISIESTLDRGIAIWNLIGISDADSNIIFPKWTLDATGAALPSTLTGANLTRNTTDWQYISGEWY